MIKLFRELGKYGTQESSLGFAAEFYSDGEVKKILLKMGIKSNFGFIYFNELLYRCMRRKYGSMKINREMQIFELKTQYKIYLMSKQKASQTTKSVSNDELYRNVICKENGVNPFMAQMNFKITYKTWLKHAKIRLLQRHCCEFDGDGDGGKGHQREKLHIE